MKLSVLLISLTKKKIFFFYSGTECEGAVFFSYSTFSTLGIKEGYDGFHGMPWLSFS